MVAGRPQLSPLSTDIEDAFRKSCMATVGIEEACAGCDHAGDCASDESPKGEETAIDMVSSLLESVKPYSRIAICSTGKSDWPKKVATVKGSLAYYLEETYSDKSTSHSSKMQSYDSTPDSLMKGNGTSMKRSLSSILMAKLRLGNENAENDVQKSVFDSSNAENFTVLNGSHICTSHQDDVQNILVFPDYKIIHNVKVSPKYVHNVVEKHLNPGTPRWTSTPLPYIATVLICSHKTRDKRCHLAAGPLVEEFERCCSLEGWDIDERGDFDYDEETEENERITKESFLDSIKTVSDTDTPTVGVFKTSHVGGHKFAGNVIVCLPNGANVWYGRVTKREVQAIVRSTIKEGKIIRELFRGAGNVSGKKENILTM